MLLYFEGGFTPLPVVGTAGLDPEPGWCPPWGLSGVWTEEGWYPFVAVSGSGVGR
jgi:hypothetical protein